jgi:AcrR family transcriptional regulator
MTKIQLEKDKILKFAQNKFFSEGFYKISMDEIAQELQMSKKTIYKYFPSKEKLVEEISDCVIDSVCGNVEEIIDCSENVVIKFVKMLYMYNSNLIKFSDKWYRDLQLHTPHIWQKIDKMRMEKIYANAKKILEQGKKEKLVENYPSEIMVEAFASTIRAVMNPEFILMNKFSMQQAFKYSYEMLLNGILTDLGKLKYQETKKLFEKEIQSRGNIQNS